MAQYLKDDVRDRIVSAALDVLASKAFRAATMADIARGAGLSTGNIYRYFPDKETLFSAVVPPTFVAEFLGLLRRRVRSLDGVSDPARVASHDAFRAASEQLLGFSIANRQRVIILLGRAGGTRYQSFAGQVVAELRNLAIAHFRGVGRNVRVTPALQFALGHIYRAWMRTMVEILAGSRDEATIRRRVEVYSRYHRAGRDALSR